MTPEKDLKRILTSTGRNHSNCDDMRWLYRYFSNLFWSHAAETSSNCNCSTHHWCFGGAADEGEWPATRVATGAGSASALGATEIKESRVHKLDAGFYQGNKVSFGVGADKCTHQQGLKTVWSFTDVKHILARHIQGSIHPRVNQSHPNPDGRLLRFPSVPRVARRASWICRVIPSPAAVSARSWRSCAGKNRWNRLVKWDYLGVDLGFGVLKLWPDLSLVWEYKRFTHRLHCLTLVNFMPMDTNGLSQ